MTQLNNETRVIKAGRHNTSGGVVAPIDLSSTFKQPGLHADGYYIYSRITNPTTEAFEEKMAALESANYALSFNSGMAAIETVLRAILKKGDEVIAFEDLYGGTYQELEDWKKFGITIKYIDASEAVNVEKAITKKTKMIWLESPTNPLLRLCPIRKIAQLKNTWRDLIIVVDNTFATPAGQRPLELGADISLHSVTKYIGGHSDLIGGAIVTSDQVLFNEIKQARKSVGSYMSPFDAFLASRGANTLFLRMRAHEDNAKKVAMALSNNSQIEKVLYPGLMTHPQYGLAHEQMSNFGGVISFLVKGTSQHAEVFIKSLKIPTPAVSLGGVESLIEIPYFMTHACISAEIKKNIGLPSNLVRLSVGLENANDLIQDIEQALKNSKLTFSTY